MSVVVEPASAVLLLVGREQYTPPSSFGGRICAATHDCIAVGVVNPSDGPTTTQVAPRPDTRDLMAVGEFDVETEGLLSVRDIYGRDYQSMGADAGMVHVVVWADDDDEPTTVFFEVTSAG